MEAGEALLPAIPLQGAHSCCRHRGNIRDSSILLQLGPSQLTCSACLPGLGLACSQLVRLKFSLAPNKPVTDSAAHQHHPTVH
jgi:hypothetical protein